MNRQPVRSSNIRSIGYSAATQLLEIEFLRGGVYQYTGVPLHIHEQLMAARSHGEYFRDHIRGRYNDRRVGR